MIEDLQGPGIPPGAADPVIGVHSQVILKGNFVDVLKESFHKIGHCDQLQTRMIYTCYNTYRLFVSRGSKEMYGERLKFLRKERKIPQKDLAELLGISIRGYQFYESENNEPNIAALVTLADFYGVTIDFLVGRTDEEA